MSRISPAAYAKAFTEAIRGKTEEETASVVRKFILTIRKNGDWRQRGRILDACEQEERKRQGRSLLTVESARPLSSRRRDALTAQFAKRFDVAEKVTKELVAGVRLTIDGTRQLDGSLRHLVNSLFAK